MASQSFGHESQQQRQREDAKNGNDTIGSPWKPSPQGLGTRAHAQPQHDRKIQNGNDTIHGKHGEPQRLWV